MNDTTARTEGPPGQLVAAAFQQRLAAWAGPKAAMSVSRCAGRRGDVDLMRAHAIELARMAPDLILVHGGRALTAVQREMHDIPIVFAGMSDPVSDGIVASLARPTFRLVR